MGPLGYRIDPPTPASRAWAGAARQAAEAVLADPAMQAKWLRHEATWFVGVDSLPNAPDGSIGGVPLPDLGLPRPLHPAQLSVTWPGYPGRDPSESAAAHRYRRDRDGAHLDGLLAEGPDKRRHLREPHALIVGIALSDVAASPLVVWEGSQEIIRAAFARAFDGIAPADWGAVDVTDAYQAARTQVFETCRRVEVVLPFGGVVTLHRQLIHGIAPWEGAEEGPRMMAYFRPLLADIARWL